MIHHAAGQHVDSAVVAVENACAAAAGAAHRAAGADRRAAAARNRGRGCVAAGIDQELTTAAQRRRDRRASVEDFERVAARFDQT